MRDFASDNAAGVHPAVLQAVIDAAPAQAVGYDGDPWSKRLDEVFSHLFGTRCHAFAVPSGTAANALSLAAAVQPFNGVWCEASAHIEVDEAGAIPFFTGGASLMLVKGQQGKLTPALLDKAAATRRADVHQVQPAALSLTQATECGTIYRPDELHALSHWAKARNLVVHMDGARFANAVASLGCHPADVSWKAGVDILSFGCIKNGGMSAEAIVVFRPDLALTIPVRRKRAGMMPSKGRQAAAQLLAMTRDHLWLENARAANAGAQRLAAAAGERLLYPVEANALFIRVTPAERELLRAQGFVFHDWELEGPDAARLVVRWDQPAESIEALAAALAHLGA